MSSGTMDCEHKNEEVPYHMQATFHDIKIN